MRNFTKYEVLHLKRKNDNKKSVSNLLKKSFKEMLKKWHKVYYIYYRAILHTGS